MTSSSQASRSSNIQTSWSLWVWAEVATQRWKAPQLSQDQRQTFSRLLTCAIACAFSYLQTDLLLFLLGTPTKSACGVQAHTMQWGDAVC